ncbi:MAG: serine hydrolase domain-containing protein [Hyphomonas sp.]
MAVSALLLAILTAGPANSETDPDRSGQLRSLLEQARSDHGLVALGAVIAVPGEGIIAQAVTGNRAAGQAGPVLEGDAWHIGSNTKMLTALGWARLVEAGHARWGMTLAEIFEGEALHPGWREVTIEDLFAHRSGAAPNPGRGWMIGAVLSRQPAERQRADLVADTLKKKPAGERGSFVYSNLGYMIAGRAMEQVAERAGMPGETYETLMQRFVLDKAPEGAGAGFGFGPPPAIQGHKRSLLGRPVRAGFGAGADNPGAMGPAGTAHVSLAGHARLLLPFLDGPDALPEAMRDKLMTPHPAGTSDYALGWAVQKRPDGRTVWLHAGSNTMWLSQVVLVKDPAAIIIINTNQADAGANKAIRELTGTLIDWESASVGR